MNIYIGNLALDSTEDEVRREFTVFGEVLSVSIMNDKYIGSGQPRGYAFVSMVSKSEGEAAITSLRGKTLRGHLMEVVEALPLSDNKGTGLFCGERANQFNRKRRQRKY